MDEEEREKKEKEKALCEAAGNGDTVRVKELLAEGVNPNATLRYLQRTPLHLAAENGHHETVSALLTAGADVNVQDELQMTPLHLAAWNGQHETVSVLLTAGADVNVRDWLQMTPLQLAAEKGHHETVSALLTAGAHVNVQGMWQGTPLHLAAENGHHETVSALLTAGADVNVQDNKQRTPLHRAAENGHHETVSALLTAGADVNVRDKWQMTPLHLAAKNGHHETVSVLLTAGAHVNVWDMWQRTPLHLAVENGHHNTVSALLTAGADVNVRDKRQKIRTPLGLAAKDGHHETVSALLTAGADVNVQDDDQRTPLHLAAENGHHETVSALLTAGADVNVWDRQQRTPLGLAAKNGHHETVSALLTAGADVNVRDDEQRTPLHLAAEDGHHETVSALLTAGADVNARDDEQRIPLHLAAWNGHHETVSASLRAGADVNAQDMCGSTPFHYATGKGHSKCVEVMLQYGAVKGSDKEGVTGQTKWFDPELVHFYQQKGMTRVSSEDPLVEEAAKQTGKTVEQILNFITKYRMSVEEPKPPVYDSGISSSEATPVYRALQVLDLQSAGRSETEIHPPDTVPPESELSSNSSDSSTNDLEQTLDTILSQLDETDVRLLLRVWSARTNEQESPGIEKTPVMMKDMMKSEYITTDDLGMLEKDMMAAGISFPVIVRDIPGVPDELKYTRTTEVIVGPMGGEVEIPGFFELSAPPGVLKQYTMVTVSTVDVPWILRGPESVNWISGYPWSLGEDTCPRELLDQVLFSPAVDINLHGAQLNGPVELHTWRPPGSEGMGCLLLKHHDGEGWTDITASTVHQIYPDRISISLQTFSPLSVLWAPIDKLISIGKMMVGALSSRTLNCWFAGYIKPHKEGVEFHVVCRDRSIKTDQYQPDFTICGRNKAMFDLYHGYRVEVTVSRQGQKLESRQMDLRAQQCFEDDGQCVQMVLNRPNGSAVAGDVTISYIQQQPPRTVCEFSFWAEGDILEGEGNRTKTHPPETLLPETGPSVIIPDSSTNGDRNRPNPGPHPPKTSQPAAEAGPSGITLDSSANAATSVLLVNNEYGTSQEGTSTTTRQVAQFLKLYGATVHCTALQASEDDKRCAKEDDVILHLPVQTARKKKEPCLEWLTDYHIIHYPDIPNDLKCIVGHVDLTSEAAKSIQMKRCQHAKLVLFNHDMPEVTEPYKGTEEAMAAGKKVKDILKDAKNADAVFSMGRKIYNYFQTKYKSLGESKPRQHFLFRPRPSATFEAISVTPGGGEKVILLSVGRVTKVEKLRGHDLAARALGEVAESISNVRLCVRGIDEDDWEASEEIFQKNLHSGKMRPTLLPRGTQEDIAQDMQQAHLVLMPSRAEPFGLIGLEAIAAGIPVLISDKSGLADMITNLIKEGKCHPDMRHRIVETSVNESDLDVTAKEWAKRIADTLTYSESEFKKAAEFKKTLLESKYWEESHQNLLRVCGLID